jgi:hypothetical protein
MDSLSAAPQSRGHLADFSSRPGRTRRRTGAVVSALALVVLFLHPLPALGAGQSGRDGGDDAVVLGSTMALRTSYVLRAHLDFSRGTIAATERIDVTNRSGSAIDRLDLSVLPRAFGELSSISDLSVDGKGVSGRWTNSSNLRLRLGRTVQPGQRFTVRLRFEVVASGRIGTSLEGRLSKANGIMQVSHWFPIVSDGHGVRYPGDSQYTLTAARIRLDLTTDEPGVRIAAPGRKVAGTGRHHVYEIHRARDFAFGASPRYDVESGSAGGVAIRVFHTSGNGGAALATAKEALVTYEAAYGQYQWPTFVIAQTGRSGSGNEYPGIVFLGAPQFGYRDVVAHETAHQWWYGMAGNDQMREPWLDEGLAEFSEAHFFGRFRPYDSRLPVNSSVYDFPNVPAPETEDDPDSYDQTIYRKSAKFLDGLRARMGHATFFRAMRTFFEANRNGVMTTREFFATFASYGAPRAYMRSFIDL